MNDDPFRKRNQHPFNSEAKRIGDYHRYSDVDSGSKAQHHTLGPGPNQAAPGNHSHPELALLPVGAGTIWFSSADPTDSRFLIADGRELLRADYPEYLNTPGVYIGMTADPDYFALPDLANMFLRGAGLTPLAAISGADSTPLPDHEHDKGTLATGDPDLLGGRGTGSTNTPSTIHKHPINGVVGNPTTNPEIPTVPVHMGVNFIIRVK